MEKQVITLAESDAVRRLRTGIEEPAEKLYLHAWKLKTEGFSRAACIAMRRALTLHPGSGTLWNGLGTVLWDIGDYEGAVQALTRATALGYTDPALLSSNLGLVLGSMKRHKDALRHHQKAVSLEPNNFHYQWVLAHHYMSTGDWKRGLEMYEVRKDWYTYPRPFPKLPYKEWKGENLNGKTILICAEQGAGDRILFSRYLWVMKKKWPKANIILCPGDELLSLFNGYAEHGICRLLPDNTPWPKADYGAFMGSMPLRFGSTSKNVPEDPGVIRQSAETLRFNVPPPHVPALKVGVCWTGNPIMARNEHRSIPLDLITQLADDAKVCLYSYQFGEAKEALKGTGANELIYDMTGLIGSRGYLGTAAALMGMDLVITVCTSVAHIAGALGIPTWVMLCDDPYWVWLREGDTTAWYPNVKLFRQDEPGDWGSVYDRVKDALSEKAAAHLKPPVRYRPRGKRPRKK